VPGDGTAFVHMVRGAVRAESGSYLMETAILLCFGFDEMPDLILETLLTNLILILDCGTLVA